MKKNLIHSVYLVLIVAIMFLIIQSLMSCDSRPSDEERAKADSISNSILFSNPRWKQSIVSQALRATPNDGLAIGKATSGDLQYYDKNGNLKLYRLDTSASVTFLQDGNDLSFCKSCSSRKNYLEPSDNGTNDIDSLYWFNARAGTNTDNLVFDLVDNDTLSRPPEPQWLSVYSDVSDTKTRVAYRYNHPDSVWHIKDARKALDVMAEQYYKMNPTHGEYHPYNPHRPRYSKVCQLCGKSH